MKSLRLGIIGMSEGNAHPYSWSAIFNGYCPATMRNCDFSAIPSYIADYLENQSLPEDSIPNAAVTHVWAQNRVISEHIARATFIPNVVDDFESMLTEVDAVLLARDDAENHMQFALPFLEAGLPIYIDKPVAHSIHGAEKLYSMRTHEQQIFTCSALRFAKEFSLTNEQRTKLGPIRYVNALTNRSWKKYSIHIIEPVLSLMEFQEPKILQASTSGKQTTLHVSWPNGCSATFSNSATEHGSQKMVVHCENGVAELCFTDAFSAFKSSLMRFVSTVRGESSVFPYEETKKIIRLIEAGISPQREV